MKFNKWTLGLAAVGVVSLASVARADEKVSQLNTALSNTTLSGYVDVGAQYESATGASYGTAVASKPDSITLNTVDIALDKPEDATPFSAGYHIELWMGPGANSLATTSTGAATSDFAVRDAYLALGTTIGGQEIDWKIGVWDTIIGYEGLTTSGNPNYTHSYGFAVEPTTHTGVQANYKVNDIISLQAGLADDSFAGGGYAATINGSPADAHGALHNPTLMGAISLTAPDSFGPMKGATLTVGDIYTASPGGAGGVSGGFGDSLYIGATIPTPISALKFGGAFDYADGSSFGPNAHIWVAGLYGTYQATDKLSFDLRGETYGQTAPILDASKHGEEFTLDAQYALWANVLSRAEIRWDHADDAAVFANDNGSGLERNSVLVGAQLIYTF